MPPADSSVPVPSTGKKEKNKMNFKKIFPVLALALVVSGCADPELTQSQKDLLTAIRAPENAPIVAKLPELCAANKENMNFRDPENGQTPLIAAVILNRQDRVKTILNSGAVIDLNAQDAKGMTALHYAVGQVSTDTVFLLSGCPAVNLRDRYGKTPLMEACRLGNVDMVKAVLAVGDANSYPGRECNVNDTDDQGRTPAMFAATSPRAKQILAILAERGVNVNDPYVMDDNAGTVLTHAIDGGNTDVALELIAAIFPENIAADPELQYPALLAMKHAIFANDVAVVRELIRRKCLLNTDAATAYRALRFARLQNWFKTFVRAGWIRDGKVPLIWAVEAENPALVKLLLEAGANPMCKDNGRHYPIEYSRTPEITSMLKKAMRND